MTRADTDTGAPWPGASGPRIPGCGRRGFGSRAVSILLCGLLVAALGCHEPRRGMASSLLGDGEDLPILRQVFGAHSHETQAWRFVVRNRRDWARVQLRDVTVDFANEMLLVETLGRRLSDGYGVEILRVWRDGGLLRVESEVSSPGPNAPPTIATPFCIAVIPKCDLKVAGFDSRPPARMRPWEQSPPPTGEW